TLCFDKFFHSAVFCHVVVWQRKSPRISVLPFGLRKKVESDHKSLVMARKCDSRAMPQKYSSEFLPFRPHATGRRGVDAKCRSPKATFGMGVARSSRVSRLDSQTKPRSSVMQTITSLAKSITALKTREMLTAISSALILPIPAF